MKSYWFYIIATAKRGTLYIGVTNDLVRRIYEHKNKTFKGFSSKYSIDKLVYAEEYNDVYEAICREKSVKKWRRAWKIRLIGEINPDWDYLYESIMHT